MNNTVYYDPPFSDEQRRQLLFEGQLLVYLPRRVRWHVSRSPKLIEEAFALIQKRLASLSVEQYADIVVRNRDSFITRN
jgi:hypothetical protein